MSSAKTIYLRISGKDRCLILKHVVLLRSLRFLQGRYSQLEWHIKNALTEGITKEQIIEAITHIAFYAGLPTAISALNICQRRYGHAHDSLYNQLCIYRS